MTGCRAPRPCPGPGPGRRTDGWRSPVPSRSASRAAAGVDCLPRPCRRSCRPCAAPVPPSRGRLPVGLRVVMIIGAEQERARAAADTSDVRISGGTGHHGRSDALLPDVGPEGRHGTGPWRRGTRDDGSATRGTGHAGSAPQGALRVRRGRCRADLPPQGPGRDGDPPGRRGSGGAVGARGARPGVGARCCRLASPSGAVCRSPPPATVRVDRSLSPVARAASATMSATTGAALVRATSLARRDLLLHRPGVPDLARGLSDLLVPLPACARPEDVAGGQTGDEGQLRHGGSFRRPPTLPAAWMPSSGIRRPRQAYPCPCPARGRVEEGSHSGLVRRS